MKKVLSMTLLLAVLLAGCASGGSFTKNSVESTTDTSWSMRYERFDGSRELVVSPPDGQAADFAVEVTTDGGSFSMTITGEDDEVFYEGTGMPTSEFVVHAEASSKYIVHVEAQAHEGGFAISWSAAQ